MESGYSRASSGITGSTFVAQDVKVEQPTGACKRMSMMQQRTKGTDTRSKTVWMDVGLHGLGCGCFEHGERGSLDG
jgi:hypothetical protein